MSAPHIGDEPAVCMHDGTEGSNLTRMVGTRLYDGNLVVSTQAEEREGYADMIVEISLCEKDVELLCENGRTEFLRSRLSVRTGDLQDRQS